MKLDTIEETLSQSSLADHSNWTKSTLEALRGEKLPAEDQNKIKNKTWGISGFGDFLLLFWFFMID